MRVDVPWAVLLVSEMTGAIVYGLGELRRKPCTTLSVRPMATPFGAAYLLGGIDDVGSPVPTLYYSFVPLLVVKT
jgi:hypothetical protein